MNFNKIKEDNFFIIDSDNLDLIESRLYGYAIIDSQIYFEIPKEKEVDGTGSYIYINNDPQNNEIKIYQDLNGNYGLYLFRNKNYFAISNSFLLICEYLKDKYELTLNYNNAKSYMSAEICSYIYEETLINEITILPRNTIFCIDKKTKKNSIEKIDYEENSIKINSQEGIDILDAWFEKWIKIIQNIKFRTDNIVIDLTGGLDSRTVFCLMASSNINLNDIHVHSITSDMYKEDFEIASEIADYFDFKLNQKSNIIYKAVPDIETYFNISFYSKLGFSKAIWPVRQYPSERIYNIVGYGGECIRNYIPSTVEENINFKANLAKKYSNSWQNPTKEYLKKNYETLEKNVYNENISLVNSNYKETRSRYHFGKSIVERFLINQINLAPLIDPLLYKLNYIDEECDDDNLIITLILDRYCKSLLNFKIEGRREISETTIKYVKDINEKYPFSISITNDNEKNELIETENEYDYFSSYESSVPYSINKAKEFLRDILNSNSFINYFKMYFPEEIYDTILLDLNKTYIGSMCDVFSAIGVFYMINIVEYSKKKNFKNITLWLNDFLEIPTYEPFHKRLELKKELEKTNKINKEISEENKIKNEQIKQLSEENKNKDEQIKQLSEKITQKQDIINEMMNSTSWKITKSLRKSRRYFKK